VGVKPCLTCGAPSKGTRCPSCQGQLDRGRNQRRVQYHGDWTRRSATVRAKWVSEHGWVCQGWGRQPHGVPEGGLHLDHTTGRVLCPTCNNHAGPATTHSAIPHPNH
jgi:hypothetical protein